MSTNAGRQPLPPTRLRTGNLSEAFGITNTPPRFSWTPPHSTVRQVAYQLTASNGWDTGRVDSGTHRLVPYGGPALGSRDRFEWTVRTLGRGPGRHGSSLRLVRAHVRGTGTPAPRRLERPVDRSSRTGDPRTGGAARLCPAPRLHAGRRPGFCAGLRHGTRHLRALHQRGAGGGPAAHPRLHELQQHPAGADLRYRAAAARRLQHRARGPHGRLVPRILRVHPRCRHVRDANGAPGAAGDGVRRTADGHRHRRHVAGQHHGNCQRRPDGGPARGLPCRRRSGRERRPSGRQLRVTDRPGGAAHPDCGGTRSGLHHPPRQRQPDRGPGPEHPWLGPFEPAGCRRHRGHPGVRRRPWTPTGRSPRTTSAPSTSKSPGSSSTPGRWTL